MHTKRNPFITPLVRTLLILCVFSFFPIEGNLMRAQRKGSLRELVDQLNKRTKTVVLGNQRKSLLVIAPEYGARIMGMSANGLDGENLLWMNAKVMSDSFWLSEKKDWNLGGARTWIAPEDAFYLDKDNKWFVPAKMDPGNYMLEKSDKNSVTCSNIFSIDNKQGQTYKVKITRHITLLEQSSRGSKSISKDVKFVGMRFTHELQNLGEQTIGEDIPYIGLWSLIQINPSGTMIIPLQQTKEHKQQPYRDYFNPIPPDRMSFSKNVVTVKIDGKYRCKYGFAPWACKKHIAFLSTANEKGEGILFIKEFSVDPNGSYLDHPWGKPSDYGDAIQMYNDDGNMGSFAELECHAPAKVLKPFEQESHTITFSAYLGKIESLKKIAGDILGIDMRTIKLFE